MDIMDWVAKRTIKESELVDLLPVLVRVKNQENLTELIRIIRRKAAKRKIIRFLTFGVFPEKHYKTRKRNRISRWIIRKLLS